MKTDEDVESEAPRGLKGVVVTRTELSDVRGREGFYHYRQYSAVELAQRRSFEDVWHLMLLGSLPDAVAAEEFQSRTVPLRRLPDALRPLLPGLAGSAQRPANLLAGLGAALSVAAADRGLRPLYDIPADQRLEDALFATALVPTVLAALYRVRGGEQPIEPRDDLPYAANYLYMLTGRMPGPAQIRAIEQYLILTVDHGFNASTFTARVIASTGADLVACLTGGLGALSGPLHGGAPSRALDTLDEIATPDRIDGWVRDRVLAGDRIMGFGHAVYRTDDPRSVLLREVAQGFGGPGAELVSFAVEVEKQVVAVLAELKPGRELYANVEFYAGVVMELCGVPREMFTPTFAAARSVGWSANVLEQAADSKIIRPSARYVGPPAPQPVP